PASGCRHRCNTSDTGSSAASYRTSPHSARPAPAPASPPHGRGRPAAAAPAHRPASPRPSASAAAKRRPAARPDSSAAPTRSDARPARSPLLLLLLAAREQPLRRALAVPVQQVDPAAQLIGALQLLALLPFPQRVEVLHRHRRRRPRRLTERPAHARPALVVQAAPGRQLLQVRRLLGVRLRDHVPLVVGG